MKKVRMKRSVAMARQSPSIGDEIDVPDVLGTSWCDSGVAEDVTPDGYEPDEEGDGLEELNVGQLRERLKASGQPTEGKKADLVERLRNIQPDADADDEANTGKAWAEAGVASEVDSPESPKPNPAGEKDDS